MFAGNFPHFKFSTPFPLVQYVDLLWCPRRCFLAMLSSHDGRKGGRAICILPVTMICGLECGLLPPEKCLVLLRCAGATILCLSVSMRSFENCRASRCADPIASKY